MTVAIFFAILTFFITVGCGDVFWGRDRHWKTRVALSNITILIFTLSIIWMLLELIKR